MTVLDEVRDFVVRRSPQPTCYDWIADHLKLSVRQHANHKTRELAKMPRFRPGVCGLCKNTRLVIRYGGM
jgi:hypothetical protein